MKLSITILAFLNSFMALAQNNEPQPLTQIKASNRNGCIQSIQILKYKKDVDTHNPIEVLNRLDEYNCRFLGVKFKNFDFRKIKAQITPLVQKKGFQIEQIYNDVVIKKLVYQGEDPLITNINVIVKNNSTTNNFNDTISIETGAASQLKPTKGLLNTQPEISEFLFFSQEKFQRIPLGYEEDPKYAILKNENSTQIKWLGIASHYFIQLLFPAQNWSIKVERTPYNVGIRGLENTQTIYNSFLEQTIQLTPQGEQLFNFQLYAGPKSMDYLKTFTGDEASKIVDYGFFSVIAVPIFYALKYINILIQNWGLSIILLTILIKLLFYPLQLRAFLASKKLLKIQPKLAEIREKYKDDKVKLQQETMSIMAQSGANPMSGCLPILPTIPVFFGLNAVIQNTFELRHAPLFLWIKDLSTADPYFITPIIMIILMYLQQQMMPVQTQEKSQAVMMKLLPIIFGFFMLNSAAGLVIYIITQTLLALIQQKFMNKKYGEK